MEQKKRQRGKRIVFDVSLEEHVEIKKRAAIHNITIKKYIMEAVEQRIMKEKKYE